MNEINTEYTAYLKCPYCADEWSDSYDEIQGLNEDELSEKECDGCSKKFQFKYTRGDISFTSYKL
jgi:hypothetical protein